MPTARPTKTVSVGRLAEEPLPTVEPVELPPLVSPAQAHPEPDFTAMVDRLHAMWKEEEALESIHHDLRSRSNRSIPVFVPAPDVDEGTEDLELATLRIEITRVAQRIGWLKETNSLLANDN